MKILGHTKTGHYLVEMHESDILAAAGYSAGYMADGKLPGFNIRARSDGHGFDLGTQIEPTAALAYIQKLRGSQELVRKSESMLRALADMLHAALPETIIPPDDAPAKDNL